MRFAPRARIRRAADRTPAAWAPGWAVAAECPICRISRGYFSDEDGYSNHWHDQDLRAWRYRGSCAARGRPDDRARRIRRGDGCVGLGKIDADEHAGMFGS